MKFETLAIHAGQEPDPNNGAVMTPVYFTSTYMQDGVGKPRQGYEYSRTLNPTRKALQDCLAALEGGNFGLTFSSGLAATDTILRLLNSEDHALAGNDVYGGTFRLFDKVLRRFNLDFTFADTTDPESVADALTPSTRLVWLETPTNPFLRITDIRAVAEIVHAHENKPLLVVDNTFATPYLQRPLELGADIVVHSMTKYLGGHSDVVGGAVIVKDKELADKLYFLQNAVGAVPGPMDCFLVLRGIKTLPLRMERHSIPCESSATKSRNAPNEEWRRDDLIHHQRRKGSRDSGCGGDKDLRARRIAWRSRIVDRGPGGDDPPIGSRLTTGG